MSGSALARGAAVGGILVGVLAVGSAPAYAWYTTGPSGETTCEFGGSYPDCNTEPTAGPTSGTTTGGGEAVETPAPAPTETVTPTESPEPSASQAVVTGGTSSGGGGATTSTTSSTSNGGTGAVVAAAPASSGGLPFTGFEAGAAAGIGLAAIGAGTLIVVSSRRRRRDGGAAA